MDTPKHILVPTDFSPASEPGLDAAATLARQFGARVSLVHAHDPTMLVAPAGLSQPPRNRLENLAHLEEDIKKALDVLGGERFAGVEVQTALLREASASYAICVYAEENDVDLVVLASHGHAGLSRILIGSVAEKVVRHSPCPVLVIRGKRDGK